MIAGRGRTTGNGAPRTGLVKTAFFVATTAICGVLFNQAVAQTYAFSQVSVQGNEYIESATITKIAGIGQGQPVSEGQMNDAVQRLVASGLFAEVDVVPSGNTLVITVVENPVINVVAFEGNEQIEDDKLAEVVKSQPRRVYSIAQAEADAAAITKTYSDASRMAARVEPRIIDRGDNRVDLVFEIREGKISEVERVSFTGNRAFSDRRLRQVLGTKQAGLLRTIIQSDTYVAERIEFDKQVLTDFYRSRGYIDAQVQSVSREFSPERDGFFLTFQVREGLQYKFGNIRAVSEYPGVDIAAYEREIRVRSGQIYSPLSVDTTISRLEGVALKQGVNFVNIEPRITRNPQTQTLDVVFALTKGPRVFVERIDIEGNATTLDKVVRRQFRTVEGDPFSPREIREASERIRALGYFSTSEVTPRQGTAPDQVIVDVNVEEKPTGSLNLGANYSVDNGVGFVFGLTEQNFLGRGQTVGIDLALGKDTTNSTLTFVEPSFLDRDMSVGVTAFYVTSDRNHSYFKSKRYGISPSIGFPLGEQTRLSLRYSLSADEIYDVDSGSSQLLKDDEARGSEVKSALGYTFSYDTRINPLDPNRAFRFEFNQDFAGVGGDIKTVTTTALAGFQMKTFNEEVTLTATLEGGMVNGTDGDTRYLDRFTGNGKVRGFTSNGYGPRDLTAGNEDALGGNYFAAARVEAQFPVGLPDEYGITGGVFADIGSVWGLDNDLNGTVDDDMNIRSTVGVSVFWDSILGPLRLNFSKAVQSEDYDDERNFDLTISTTF